MPRNPVGFAHGIDGIALKKRDRRTVNLVHGPCIKFHIAGEGNNICAGLFDWFAYVHGFKGG